MKAVYIPQTESVPKTQTSNGCALMLQIISEPIPDDCSPEMHADYEGYAVQWGLGNKKHSAAECCRACKEFKPKDGLDGCNIWVWCGESGFW